MNWWLRSKIGDIWLRKHCIRKSLAVEADLLAAEQIAVGDDESLRLLRRNFVNSGHLLNRCKDRDEH